MVGVAAGNYTCNVTDNQGCVTSQSVAIQQPAPMVITNSAVTNITCNGFNNGQISTVVQGGNGSYTYSWTPTQLNSSTITNLPPGGINVVITDPKGCFINTNFTILEPSPITSAFSSTPSKCGLPNGSATVTVNGGTPGSTPPGYTMNWNTSPLPQQGLTAGNMATGSVTCTITDNNGCTAIQTVTVGNAPGPTVPTYTVTAPSCFGVQDGAITIAYTSGTPDYQSSWSSPISVVQTSSNTTQSVSNVGAGNYIVTVTDAYGCTASNIIPVTGPTPLTLTTTAAQTICFGEMAQISATGSGGSPGYTYNWTPAGFSNGGPHTLAALTANTSYSVSVTDSHGCVTTQTTITVIVTPSLNIIATSYTLCDGLAATLTPTITSAGNGAPYSFTWSNGITDNGVSNSTINITAKYPVSPVYYTVTVTDDGCSAASPGSTATFTVVVNPRPVINFTRTPNGCAPLTVILTGTSNGVNDIYEWGGAASGTGNPKQITFADSGKYSISLHVINPATGCSADTIRKDYITVFPKPIASFYATPQSASILDPTIYFTNTSQGATNYSWDFGDPATGTVMNSSILVDPNHYYDHVGQYNVHLFATSNLGCIAEALMQVEITPDFALYIPNSFTPDGNNINDIFQPMGVGINEDNYRMDIFDRWGELIFTTNNFRKGWDGSVKGGKQAPQGAYVYKLMVYDMEGGKHPFVGHVTVIKKDGN
jgi:gliding motility-associated-like protein